MKRSTFPIVHADEGSGWDRLHASYDMRRVNHSVEYVAEDGANVNQAESWFSRLRRAEHGVHHRISGRHLQQYANEMAWREDHRREPNGLHYRRIIGIKPHSVLDDGRGKPVTTV